MRKDGQPSSDPKTETWPYLLVQLNESLDEIPMGDTISQPIPLSAVLEPALSYVQEVKDAQITEVSQLKSSL
jgi:hypothetical protein